MLLHRLALTDAPTLSANTLYDFETSPDQFTSPDGASWGAPEWTADPGSVGGSDGYRTVTFNHYMTGGMIGAYAELTRLARVLLRPDAWLLVQITATSEPRWFHVWRSSPADLSPENLFVHDGMPAGMHGISISLTADSYLYGERQTLPTQTVANDPTAAQNPMSCVLDGILGDAPAPLRIGLPFGPLLDNTTVLLATFPAATGADVEAPVILDIGIGDTWTPTGDTQTAPVADATYAGGSYRWSDFTTTSDTWILPGQLSSPEGVVPPGRWLLLVRLSVPNGNVATFHLGTEGDAVDAGTQAAITSSTMNEGDTWAAWVSLGELTGMGSGIPADVVEARYHDGITLLASLADGASNLRWDALMLIPLASDDNTRIATALFDAGVSAALAGHPTDLWWDGDEETYWGYGAADGAYRLPNRQQSGVYPVVVPGVQNRLTLVQTVYTAGRYHADKIDATAQLELSYHPRFLWPAP